MSKSYFEKNQKEKEKQNKTAGSSKTVSNPTVKTTQSQTAKKTTQKSQPTYWQATQQTQNKQATQQARKDLNISQPKKQALTASQKRQMQTEARAKRNKYAEAERKAKQYNAETSYDYSQANEGIKAMFRKGESASAAMNKYAHANQKALAQDRANRLGQAELAQAVVDRDIKRVEDNEVLNVLSDINRSTLGGVTSGIGGLIRTGGNLARGYAGITGNQSLADRIQKADAELGIDEALRNVNEDNIVANNMVGKVAQSIGNMVPTIGATILSGGSNAAGLGLMGASVFGNEGAQALNNLSQDGSLSRTDTARALGTGAAKAGLEVGTEMLSSIFPGLDTFAFTNPSNLLGQAGGEALEEMVSSAIEPFIDPIASPDVKSKDDWDAEAYRRTFGNFGQYAKDIGESGLLGAATSLAMGGGANLAQNTAEYVANRPIANRIEEAAEQYQNKQRDIAETPITEVGQEPVPPQLTEEEIYQQVMQKPKEGEFDEELMAILDELLNGPEEVETVSEEQKVPDALKRMFEAEPAAMTRPVQEYERVIPEVETEEINPDAFTAAEIENPEVAWNQYEPSKGGDTYQIANENGEVFEEQEQKPGITERITEKVKSLFGNKKIISDKAMDYILKNYTEAVTSGDPQAVKRAAGEIIHQVASDTDVPPEIVEQIAGDLNVNKTVERLSKGDAVGYVQENVNETDAPEYAAKIKDQTDDTTYQTTRLTPVANVARQMNSKVGTMNEVYDDLMKASLGKGKMDRFSKAFKNQFGIQTDYDAVVYTARVMDLKDQISAEMNKVTNEIKAKGYEVELVPTPSGENTVRLMKDGKVVEPAEMSQYASNLAELSAKNDDITLRATNIGHNVGTLLRMFRTDLLSPAGQIKGINQTIDEINAELDKKFGKKIRSGELEHVKLDEDLVKQFLEATDDVTRAALMEKMGEDIGHQVPPTFMEKLDAFRYNNLLFNGLTWVRNFLGNFTQSQMANAKNLSLYIIESYAKARGLVRYNNLDMANAGDKALLARTARLTSDTLINDYADAKKSGNVKKHLKSLGYNGALLNAMQHFKGTSFNLNQIDSGFSPILNEVLANNAKKAGYTIKDGKVFDKNGAEVTGKTYRELINDSYKQAKKRWISSDSLRRAKVDGIGMGTASRTQRNMFWNEGFDILNPDYESVAGMRSDSKAVGKDAFMKGYNQTRRSEIFSDKNPFGWIQNRESRIIDYAMNKAPLLGDEYWLRSGYSKAMASMLDARGYHAEINNGAIELYDSEGDAVPAAKANEILAELNGEALRWAQEDTYHDRNDLSNLLNEFARSSSLAKFAVNATIPFINTPMNIARRAIEYSPIGLGASLVQLNQVKEGKISASTWLNNMAKGATGASAMLIGAWLAKNGILRGLGDKDDDQIHRFETAKGLQDYSLQIPFFDGWSTTVDWLAPGVAPFLLGAAMWEQHSQYEPRSKDETAIEGAANLLMEDFANFGTLFRPIADTTMLSGLMDTLSVFGKETWAQDLGAQILQNYSHQLTPVLGSKLTGIIDPVKYSTSSDSFLDRQLRSAAINIRLIDWAMTAINEGEQYLKPQLDLNGKPVETQDYGMGAWGRAITNLLNPATVKEDTRDSTDLELERLYGVTQQQYLLPSITASINGTKFTPEERDEFNQYLLPEYKKAAKEFINSTAYGDYTDQERAKILYSMRSHFYAEAQAKYLGRIIPNADSVLTKRDKACDFVNSMGVSVPHFYGYINTDFDSDSEGNHINNTRAMKIRAQMEADGIWDNITKAIDKGTFEPGDFNLNKAVLGWDTTEFTYYYNQMLNGQYDGTYKKKKK